MRFGRQAERLSAPLLIRLGEQRQQTRQPGRAGLARDNARAGEFPHRCPRPLIINGDEDIYAFGDNRPCDERGNAAAQPCHDRGMRARQFDDLSCLGGLEHAVGGQRLDADGVGPLG